jgi:UDP-N-acetylmuramoyl-L-alanyl-D-glutamate--2,6-diaminopimelate ligase
MGRVASELADEVVLTNDNPRSEDPLRIIEEIRSGCSHDPLVLPDRRAAIRAALGGSRPGDVVVIAGKGHEQGQQFADRTDAFDDRRVAAAEIRALLGGAP